MKEKIRVLIIGCGSIGERHTRVLQKLGIGEIILCDANVDNLTRVAKKYNIKETYIDYNEAFKSGINAVVICTPNNLHIPIALKACEENCHIFTEKPLSHTLDDVDRLIKLAEERNLVLMVGYCLRFHPALIFIKKVIDERKIGNILSFRFEVGSYLPEWRPGSDYRKNYAVSPSSGGGVILDLSHEIDYVQWLGGKVREVFCYSDTLSDLEIKTEDTAEILLRFENRAIGEVHMDYVQRAPRRDYQIIGDKGTILCDYNEETVKVFTCLKKVWETYSFKIERDDIFAEQDRHFFQCIKENKRPLVDGVEGKKSLILALTAKESSKKGMPVKPIY